MNEAVSKYVTSLLGELDINFIRHSNQFGPFWVLSFAPQSGAVELILFASAEWLVALHTLPPLSDVSAFSVPLLRLNSTITGSKIALMERNPVVIGETSLAVLSKESLVHLVASVLTGVEKLREFLAQGAES